MKHYNFDFDESGVCKLTSHTFIVESTKDKMFVLIIGKNEISLDYVYFYFPRISALKYFLEYYTLNHSLSYWRKLKKRFPMYRYKQCLKIVDSYHKYQMWL